MDLPFAASDTYSFFVLMITFGMLIIGFAIIIFLNILYIKNNKIKNEEFYSQINKSFSELKESVDALGLMFSRIKDNLEDFKSDKKWQNYLEWCDRYFWAVDSDFPKDILPFDTGLIIADSYDAKILREAPLNKLSVNRRK